MVILCLKPSKLLKNLISGTDQKRLRSKYVYENIFTYSQEMFIWCWIVA